MVDRCTFLISVPDKVALPSQAELQAELESTDVSRKVAALKKAILLLQSGEDMPRNLMTVIRYCITVEDHTLQKLLMLYWEVARKYDAGGKLLPEMILVCNALLNNLNHPNEYIRGATLRFLTKVREPEILESLVPSIKKCFAHRHPYVRRNAVLAAFSVFKHCHDLYPDAPEDVERVIEEETDAGTRRNAFVMLFNSAQEKALAYLQANIDRVLTFGDGFALILLDLIRKTSRGDPSRKAKFIRIVYALVEDGKSLSASVSFEAASTLVSLSVAPSAVRAAAGAWIKILHKESDNNVKLIVLERLSALRKRHAKVLREVVMDILRALGSPNADIRRLTLDICCDLVTSRNVDEVMGTLKKELLSTGAGAASASTGGGGAPGAGTGSGASGGQDPEDVRYRSMLIAAIHGVAVRFADVAPAAVHLLMDFLSMSTADGALTVIEFVREIVETYPPMRASVLGKLRDVMTAITASDVHRVALWLLGQYSISEEEVSAAIHTIRECIGPLPLTMGWGDYKAHVASGSAAAAAAAGSGASGDDKAAASATKRSGPVVLADGTYATQSAATSGGGKSSTGGAVDASGDDVPIPHLRRLLLCGDFFLASAVASALTKLALRVVGFHGLDSRPSKTVIIDSMLVMCGICELGASGYAGTTALLPASALPTAGARGSARAGAPGTVGAAPGQGVRIDQDSFERVVMCMRILGDPAATAAAAPVLLNTCKETFRSLLAERRARAVAAAKEGVASVTGFASGTGSVLAAPSADAAAAATGGVVVRSSVDEALNVRLLRGARGASGGAGAASGGAADDAPANDFDDSLSASGSGGRPAGAVSEAFSERLKRIHQLTGFADPVYAEAYVRVSDYDIILEILLINRSETSTLTNVSVELSTMGDLRLVERPPSFTLGPKDSKTIKANVKVSSTETGHIFGTITYDAVGPSVTGDRSAVINLAEIHVDIMDYIHPAVCSDSVFRSMWADFEWENKVNVSTGITNLQEFVHHIAKSTNMRILTPIAALAGCNFLAANLYARSVFGEDALVNVSIENKPDGSIKGHIRIRAKTQGVALSLGDRITSKQKG